MRLVVQRVKSASVSVDGNQVSRIDEGLLVLAGVADGDSDSDARRMASKLCRLRILRDEDGKMNKSVIDSGGSVLVVSQFTLLADIKSGNRPSFARAARPEVAEQLLGAFVDQIVTEGVHVLTGEFGAMMDVGIVNDGPVTIVMD